MWDSHTARMGEMTEWYAYFCFNPLPYKADCETVWATDVLLLIIAFYQ
jgi:hypothetical protein